MEAPFFSFATASQLPADYCQACPQALAGGFCGARIQPECLRIDATGVVRVSLMVPAATWFATLAQFGSVWHVLCNPVSVLGSLGPLPGLSNWEQAVLPADGPRRFLPNLAEYGSLWAVRETSPLGVVFGLEVRDLTGTVFERILLPAGANLELFRQFVVDHQSPPAETVHWFSPNHAASTRRCRRLARRIPALHEQWSTGDRNVRRLSARFIPKLFIAAAQAGLSLRTSFYHPAMVRTVRWLPAATGVTKCGKTLPELFQGAGVSLQLQRRAMAGGWLWKGHCACCPDAGWSVEVADVHQRVGLAIMAGTEAGEACWRGLIESITI